MYLCLRIDLDYVPWDTPDATEFGHGEPATLLRILDFARTTGYKFHFFISNRAMRAFPASADAVLNDGHDLDWLCKHPEEFGERWEEALTLFEAMGHTARGLATKAPWPNDENIPDSAATIKFISAPTGPVPKNVQQYVVATKALREATRAGQSARNWADNVKSVIREHASRNKGVTVVVRPQVLAKLDPRLTTIREIVELANAVGCPPFTLRDLYTSEHGKFE